MFNAAAGLLTGEREGRGVADYVCGPSDVCNDIVIDFHQFLGVDVLTHRCVVTQQVSWAGFGSSDQNVWEIANKCENVWELFVMLQTI